jgi:hypothetical protein
MTKIAWPTANAALASPSAAEPAVQVTEKAKAEVLAFTLFPRRTGRRSGPTDPYPGHQGDQTTSSLVGIFPNPAVVIRLVGPGLADKQDEWQAGDRRCLSEGSALLCPRQRYWTHRRDRQRRVGTEDHLKAHHPRDLARDALGASQ